MVVQSVRYRSQRIRTGVGRPPAASVVVRVAVARVVVPPAILFGAVELARSGGGRRVAVFVQGVVVVGVSSRVVVGVAVAAVSGVIGAAAAA